MRTISMDMKEYKQDIAAAEVRGHQRCVLEVSDFFRQLFVVCDYEGAWYKAEEIFGKHAESIRMHLAIKEPK